MKEDESTMEHLFPVMPILHLGSFNNDEVSWWLLGTAAGFVLAVAAYKAIWSRI